ncbi:MAG TPA: M15 family metallopeptidase [Mollicutes bacterium]|nr:M15 family metallopeptidase [Mollicutes bacterium]
MQKKKRRLKISRIIIPLVLIILIGFGIHFVLTPKNVRELKKLNYNNDTIEIIIDKKLDAYLIENNIYSKTLDKALLKGEYKEEYLEEYINLPYKDYDEYINQVNKLNDLKYARVDVKAIIEKLDEKEIDVIIDNEIVLDNIVSYFDNKYFIINNLTRYANYKKANESYDVDTVISYVNMYLDYPFYGHDVDIAKIDDLLVIANKYYKLGSDFIPKELVTINAKYRNSYNHQVRPIVKESYEKMAEDMFKIGLRPTVTSSYRSYATQKILYDADKASNGVAMADKYTARPGYSEHQTGLAIDVKDGSGQYAFFKNSDEYKWMKDNAHKYGFILRYPEGKEHITGFSFEAWHYRYVGVDVATFIYENDLTFDEYHMMYIANKKD